ncbi:hypothetical protein JB92DRAFT_3094929 [Gautieria morchelliformis]|nr:hypothetical protein JB92DRAFT_3094929 [Gautieria morchelliformis]
MSSLSSASDTCRLKIKYNLGMLSYTRVGVLTLSIARMAQLADIPNEILLQFFSSLHLKALIAARGVNHHWRHLVPHAAILPARRALLDLYLKIIQSPLFIPTRPWVLSRLRPFDRKAYLGGLLTEHKFLPEEFCLWVLEWPARAAIRGSWPGLPACGLPASVDDPVQKIGGYNWLGYMPPRLSAMSFGCPAYGTTIPALCLWVGNGEVTWLVLDKRDALRGKVHELYTDGYFSTTEDGLDDLVDVYASFIDWQKCLWEKVERRAAYSCKPADMCGRIDTAASRGLGLTVYSPPVPLSKTRAPPDFVIDSTTGDASSVMWTSGPAIKLLFDGL